MHRTSRIRLVFGALTLVAGLGAGFAASAHAETANLLLNPGFEEGIEGHPWMPAGWDTSVSGMPSVFFGRDTFLVHSGEYSINVANASMILPMAHNWSQTLVVGPDAWNKDAVFTIWTRSNGVEGRGYVLLQAYRDTISRMAREWKMGREEAREKLNINKVDDPLIDLGWQRQFFNESETGWVRRELRVFIPPSTNVIFVRGGVIGTGQVIFDDASLTLETAKPAPELPLNTNLLADSSFEGDGNAWEYSMPPFENLHVGQVTGIARTGKHSIGVWGGLKAFVQSRAGVCQVISNRNLAGKRVRLTSHVKPDSLQGVAYIKIFIHSLRGVEHPPTPQQFSGTTDWQTTSMEIDLPEDTYQVWVWSLLNCPAPGRVYFDDMEFVVLGPATGEP